LGLKAVLGEHVDQKGSLVATIGCGSTSRTTGPVEARTIAG
jgi:hypothetical protein